MKTDYVKYNAVPSEELRHLDIIQMIRSCLFISTMPPAIEHIIKQRVIAQYLNGNSRDRIAADNGMGTGTVSNILDEWKRAVQGSDYESVRELAVHCKMEGVNLGDLMSALRIKNYIKQIDADEERIEQFIARCANSQNPQKLLDV